MTRTRASRISLAVTAVVLSWASIIGAWTPVEILPAGFSHRTNGPTVPRQSAVPRSYSSTCLYSSAEAATTATKTGTDDGVSDEKKAKLQKRLKEQRDRKPPQIICCSSTKELVQAVNAIVTKDHTVAELGSQLRDVSDAIRSRASSDSVYCDVQRDYPKAAAKSNPNTPEETTRTSAMRLEATSESSGIETTTEIDFREIEKFADWRSAFFGSSSSSSSNRYDVLVLDVNAIVGNDLEWTCLDLVLEFEQMAAMVAKNCGQDENYHGLKYVLVKSLGLNSVASQLTHTVPWLDPNKTNHNRLCRIVATVGVHNYRQTIPGVLALLQQSHLKAAAANPVEKDNDDDNDDDNNASNENKNFFVVEVGSHFGTSTVILDQVFDHVMGVDVGSKIIREAQKKYPDVFFRTGDAWKTAGLLRLQQEYYRERGIPPSDQKIGFDAVYVDVGGLSGADGLLDTIALVKTIQYSLEPQCIVVKSLCLQRLASRFTPYWKWQKKGTGKLN